ncbi:PapD-like protein [Gilbertella persicaria]|uniref:PapD-like protein n=1 Tax=Gilbertella persicaria TaxID=101096 RepID=UPI0022202A61|nr:PapD-like protein [Gilbertella persicaria]KAI8087913.1 PapD-like protein [Gilbertella persicaria]
MSVVIEPSEQLEFHRPFTRVSKESLHVKNPGPEPIIFKVKTTAPKQYCVRPNAGRIEANSQIEVQIILQPFREEPPEDFKCKDKFLVQTALFPSGFDESQQDITSMWSHIEANVRDSMHQHKIKCVFLGPRQEEETQQHQEVSPIPEQVKNTEKVASSPTSPSLPNTAAPTTVESPSAPSESVAAPAAALAPAATVGALPVTQPNTTTTNNNNKNPNNTTTSAPVQTIIEKKEEPVQTEPQKNDTTEQQLKESLEKIKLLEKQLADIRKEEGLRARNLTGTSARKLASTVQPLDAVHQHLAALETPRPTEGYPPQVVMGIALLVFVFTYLFF